MQLIFSKRLLYCGSLISLSRFLSPNQNNPQTSSWFFFSSFRRLHASIRSELNIKTKKMDDLLKEKRRQHMIRQPLVYGLRKPPCVTARHIVCLQTYRVNCNAKCTLPSGVTELLASCCPTTAAFNSRSQKILTEDRNKYILKWQLGSLFSLSEGMWSYTGCRMWHVAFSASVNTHFLYTNGGNVLRITVTADCTGWMSLDFIVPPGYFTVLECSIWSNSLKLELHCEA